MIKKHFIITAVLSLFISLNTFDANAFEKEKLYQAQQVVVDQTRTTRNKAISEMFGQVLVKVSGQSKITDHPAIKTQLKSALSFATEFGFDDSDQGTKLSVTFNESLVDTLLKDNGFTLWDAKRPSVMLWMVYEDEQGARHILKEQSDAPLVITAKKAAARRGLPLLLPIWDLDDQLTVSVGDIWGQFEDKLSTANARYMSDYMILAKVLGHGISQQVSWSVFKMGNDVDIFGNTSSQISMTGSDEAATLDIALIEVINQSTDFFAQQYSVDTSEEEGSLVITLNNVDSLSTYSNILGYLNSVKAVEQVTLVNVKAQEYQFKINLLGTKQSFLDVLSLSNKMARLSNYDSSLVLFQWRG